MPTNHLQAGTGHETQSNGVVNYDMTITSSRFHYSTNTVMAGSHHVYAVHLIQYTSLNTFHKPAGPLSGCSKLWNSYHANIKNLRTNNFCIGCFVLYFGCMFFG